MIRRFPEQFQALLDRHSALKGELIDFVGQKGAAPEREGAEEFPDQTTELGKRIILHGKEIVSLITGAKPHNITAYVASGTGSGEPLIGTNGFYNQFYGTFHVLNNGSFAHRIWLQARKTAANLEAVHAPYGSTFDMGKIKKHFEEKAGNWDTIALTHLETSTAAQNNVPELIEQISEVYRNKKLNAPVFIVDATSTPGLNIKEWDEKDYKVAAYMGTAKPITAHAMHGIVYSTDAAEEEMKQRRKEFLKCKVKKEKKIGRKLADVPLYFDHVRERQNQLNDVRSRFTQPAKAMWRIANNLLWFLYQGAQTPTENLEQLRVKSEEVMDEKRKILQDYYVDALGTLGFELFAKDKARSTMLVSFVRPEWLKKPQELLKNCYDRFKVGIHFGYIGKVPLHWKKTIHPRVESHTDIFRINTYYPRIMKTEFEQADAIIKTAKNLAEKYGVLTEIKTKQLEDLRTKLSKNWSKLQEKYNLRY